MDLMEVPSHVVERFANSPAVLKAFMPHQISGRAMGQAMVNDLQESQRIFEGLQLHQQVIFMTACAPCCCVHTYTSIAHLYFACWKFKVYVSKLMVFASCGVAAAACRGMQLCRLKMRHVIAGGRRAH